MAGLMGGHAGGLGALGTGMGGSSAGMGVERLPPLPRPAVLHHVARMLNSHMLPGLHAVHDVASRRLDALIAQLAHGSHDAQVDVHEDQSAEGRHRRNLLQSGGSCPTLAVQPILTPAMEALGIAGLPTGIDSSCTPTVSVC